MQPNLEEYESYSITNFTKIKDEEILNLLNVKYILQTDRSGATQVMENPNALGNAWFVKQLSIAENADKLMQSLDTLSPKKHAITLDKSLKETRICAR